jgi:ketosteroid isomerase-like protein
VGDCDRLRWWLERFARAWEARDPELAAPLFTERALFRETPFDEPLVGVDEIRAHWSGLPPALSDIGFTYEILAVTESGDIVHWRGSYTRADRDARVEVDGILSISLDGEGRCRDFREWSIRRELPVQ